MALHTDVYFWCALQALVFFKLVSNTIFQGMARKKARRYEHPEDQVRAGTPAPDGSPAAIAFHRAKRVWINDMENLIPFSLLSLAAAFCLMDVRIYLGLLFLYVIARVLHTVALMKGLQPHRSIGYSLGLFCALALAIFILIRLCEIIPTLT